MRDSDVNQNGTYPVNPNKVTTACQRGDTVRLQAVKYKAPYLLLLFAASRSAVFGRPRATRCGYVTKPND